MGAGPPGSAATPPDAGASDDAGGDQTVVTITKGADGSYTVYAGDEPDDEGSGDGSGMSEDDDAAMAGGASGGSAASDMAGQHADSVGQALKLAMDIMNADKSSTAGEGSAQDQFAAGFNGGSGT
jgi:hypothetical protein